MPDIKLIREVWDGTKREDQPCFDEQPFEFRSLLEIRADRVLDAQEPTGDGEFVEFEQGILNGGAHKVEPVDDVSEPPAEVKEELVEEVIAEQEAETEKEHVEPKGQLPQDFPAHDKLHEAGINTYGQLCKVEDLTEIPGIGPETAKLIKKRLKADEKALNK